VIVLVRHAEAVAPSDPRFEENDRPLAEAGRRDAERLADQLADEAVDAIYSSPYPRAMQTVEPLARRVGAEISLIDDLRERLLSRGACPTGGSGCSDPGRISDTRWRTGSRLRKPSGESPRC
jgi:broad specificity phosphatase PhoE